MKITILGPSGSGKSNLAKRISAQFNIARIEIDRIWHKHEGHKYLHGSTVEQYELITSKIRKEIEEFFSSNDSWVIEGSYTEIQPLIADKADVVILIKRHLVKRVWSHVIRIIKGKDRHPEVTKLQDIRFIKTIVRRWIKGEDTKFDEFAKQYSQKLIILKSFREIDRYFETLKAELLH
jgi:adenylate kinase family enzyme